MKKKRIVKLEPQTVELFAEVLSKLRPPPPLTVSQWADRYRVLSAESSAEPGRWHTEKAPYQRAIMDAIGDPHVRSVVVMSAAQIGKTDAFILNPLGYYMDYAPCPVMCMQPTLDMGQTLSKDRIAPMIRDTPRLTGLVDTKSRYAGNTVMKKNFPGGHITIVGANSPSSLASRPIKVLLADEIDRYPKSAGTEGDPLDLAKKRQTTFWDYKTVMVSTPTIKGDSRIEDAYLLSTQEEWNVPCPECGAYQPFLWENVKFDKDDLDKGIGYVCRECGCVSNEYRWKEQGKYGKYVAANPGAESRGFHLNTLASTFVGWKEIVTKFIEAKIALDHGNPEQMKVWVNTELGETWEERGIQLEDIELFNRREIYAAEVPDDVLYLTAGVDVQDDRFEVEVVGWGEGTESWGVRYQKIFGDMLSDQVWGDLDNFLLRTWHTERHTRCWRPALIPVDTTPMKFTGLQRNGSTGASLPLRAWAAQECRLSATRPRTIVFGQTCSFWALMRAKRPSISVWKSRRPARTTATSRQMRKQATPKNTGSRNLIIPPSKIKSINETSRWICAITQPRLLLFLALC